MGFTANLQRTPVAKIAGLSATRTGKTLSTSNIVTVNQRRVVGGLQEQFVSNDKTREKMQLKQLMQQAKSEDYKNNPVMARRLQQQIASKASRIYGINSQKMMGGKLNAIGANNYGGGTSLKEKVNGRK